MDTSVPFVTDYHGNAVKQPLNEWYRTPNMERLAKQGIRFSTFYAQSVSSPSSFYNDRAECSPASYYKLDSAGE